MAFSRQVGSRFFVLLVLGLSAILTACSDKPQQGMGDIKVPVSVVEVQPQAAEVFAELPGRVNAIEDAQIRARVTGIVQSIEFKQGSHVQAGQLLFVIDPAPYKAARDQARARLQNAKAAAHTAELQSRRFAVLIKRNAISRQDYDNAVAQAEQARAEVAAAQASLDAAEINLSYTEVSSPIDGQIGKSLVTVGALVSAEAATQLATVHRLDEVYVDITQPVSQLSAQRRQIADGILTPDQAGARKITVLLDDGEPYRHAGELLFSGVAVDPATSQVNLRALFPNPEEILLPGMYVRVRLSQGIDEKALIVPEQAVQRSPDGNSIVVVVRDGKAVFSPVQVGSRSGNGYIITQGLQAADVVVVEGFQKIRPGAPVQPIPWKAGASAADAASGTDASSNAGPGAPAAGADASAAGSPADSQAPAAAGSQANEKQVEPAAPTAQDAAPHDGSGQ